MAWLNLRSLQNIPIPGFYPSRGHEWLVAQSCLTLCNPLDCSLPGCSCPWDSAGKNTGVGCHFLLQGSSPTQGSKLHHLCLLHCRWILYPLSHQGSSIPVTLSQILPGRAKESMCLSSSRNDEQLNLEILLKFSWGHRGVLL